MRDPERIDRILNIIKKIWKENPDLRLCQIIMVAYSTGDPFYFEDESLERNLKERFLIKN